MEHTFQLFISIKNLLPNNFFQINIVVYLGFLELNF